MMRWPWRRDGAPQLRESKELAKSQLEIATVIEHESRELARWHRWILWNNHFEPNAHDAFRERRRS